MCPCILSERAVLARVESFASRNELTGEANRRNHLFFAFLKALYASCTEKDSAEQKKITLPRKTSGSRPCKKEDALQFVQGTPLTEA